MVAIRRFVAAAAALAALTCAYTWPLVGHMRTTVPHDRGDPLLVTWILWWTAKTVPLTTAWWNAPAFYPSTGVLAFSENLLGLAPISAPIIWLTKAPLVAYNVAFLLSYVLSGLGAYMLAFVLTRRHDASFVAALAFAFAPYRLSHLQHIQLLSSYWMPVAIAALHLYASHPRQRWATLFAASWLMQALACGYYLFYLTMFVVLWLVWFAPVCLTRRQLARLGVTWLAAACLAAPLLVGYRAIHAQYGFRRSPAEIAYYSADIAGLLSASPDSLLWRGLYVSGGTGGAEAELFPGLTIVILIGLGLTLGRRHLADRTRRSTVLFYVLSAVLMWALALGPRPALLGRPLGVPGPYELLMGLPGFDGMRVPARLWMLSVLCLAVAGALIVARIESRRRRRLVTALATVGLLLDGWPRAFALVAAPEMRVTTTHAGARLGLPLQGNETETMYGAIAQARPVFDGYSGYEAPQHHALRDLLEQHDPRILARLAAAAPIEIVVESAADADSQWRTYVERAGARRVDTAADWTSYELPATGAFAPPAITGVALPVAELIASENQSDMGAVLDGNLDTRWHAQAQRGGETITVDLGGPRHVNALVLCLGAYAAQYPRVLVVESSADTVTWTPVYTGGTALETYDAAIRSSREVPITIPVRRNGVRYLRLRQTGADPRAGWTIVELRVIG